MHCVLLGRHTSVFGQSVLLGHAALLKSKHVVRLLFKDAILLSALKRGSARVFKLCKSDQQRVFQNSRLLESPNIKLKSKRPDIGKFQPGLEPSF